MRRHHRVGQVLLEEKQLKKNKSKRKRYNGDEIRSFPFKQTVPLLLLLVHSSTKRDFFRQCK